MDMKWLLGELDEEEEELTAVTCIIAAEYFSRMWVHPINYDRRLHDEFHQLMPQLLEDEGRRLLYCRMSKVEFYRLLNMVAPKLEKCSTQFRESISPQERLAVCLR
jgi:hypothetical protein